MALETASYIANLVESNPDGGDQRSTADDHLRLVKAALKRTFPKLDAAVSLSATQLMFLGDLSASVQVQLNALRDGPATANFAVTSRFAQSASTAALIGTLPAARVPDLAAANIFTASEPARVQHSSGFLSFYNTAGNTRTGYLQMVAGSAITLAADAAIQIQLVTNGVARLIVGTDGSITIPGAIVGTISNATNAVSATTAISASNASTANTAQFATSAGSSALLSGLAPSDTGGGNTIAQRNSSGYLFAGYFNQSSTEGEAGAITSFGTFQGDNYIRKATPSQVGAQLSAQNVTGRTGTAKTLSSSAPSGGSNGDIHYQY